MTITMMTRAIRPTWILTASLLLLLVVPRGAAAEDSGAIDPLTIPLSDSSRPVTLQASLFRGSLVIECEDRNNVIIEIVSARRMRPAEAGQTEGMRIIPNTNLGLEVEEQGNHVSIDGGLSSSIEGLRIKVPRRTSMTLATINGGRIAVQGAHGELELKNTNGPISAMGIIGSVVASTTNGDVTVGFDAIEPDKAMSFVTFNGQVDVTFPPDLRADLRLRTDNGEIFTDFDFEVESQSPRVTSDKVGMRTRVEVDREVRARIAGGGPEMHFKTWQGNIYIRKGGREGR